MAIAAKLIEDGRSLPSRERGLKCHGAYAPTRPRPSLPSRERGLKCRVTQAIRTVMQVAPFTGAWIEIHQSYDHPYQPAVAPFTGAWIEIAFDTPYRPEKLTSLPSRERGLKLCCRIVAVLVERRSLHGSVD